MSSLLTKRKLPASKDVALSDSDDPTEHDRDDDFNGKFDDNSSIDSAAQPKGSDKNTTDVKLNVSNKAEEEVLLQTTKRPRYAKPFTEDLLTSWDGLRRIYEEFPKQCKYNARGSEAAYLSRLLGLYKEWAFQLHPGIAFNDLLRKTETLGSRGRVRVELGRLRDTERERYVEAHYPSVKEERERQRQLAKEREEEDLRMEEEQRVAREERDRLRREADLAERAAAQASYNPTTYFGSNYSYLAAPSASIAQGSEDFQEEDLPADFLAMLDAGVPTQTVLVTVSSPTSAQHKDSSSVASPQLMQAKRIQIDDEEEDGEF